MCFPRDGKASTILHDNLVARQLWRARVLHFRPSERPPRRSDVADITPSAAPVGAVIAPAGTSRPLGVTRIAKSGLVEGVHIPAAPIVLSACVPAGLPARALCSLSTGGLFQGRRMICESILAGVGR